MKEMMVGVVMMLSSTGGAPVVETPRAAIAPGAFTFELPDVANVSPNLRHRLPNERSRQLWRRGPLPTAQPTRSARFNKGERLIVAAAGAFGGFLAGGAIGFYTTQCRQCDDDGVSGLRGVVIGAPIGAAVGAILGYRLTR
jgi:hypothetical protein